MTKSNKRLSPGMGRDLWFSMAQNYDVGGGNGKYYMLYVTSPVNTTVNIQVTGSSATKKKITGGEVIAFRIPLAWEVTSSGEVEDKAIRVWSDNADLTAYLLSRNPYTSDGMYIIPSIGWGTEYVVAGYQSLYELSFDYPSEFVMISNQDNTVADITPTQDIRATRQPNVVLHRQGVTFQEKLNRGQVVQYQLTQAQNSDDWDVTGTIVTSNNPVGIVGASQCPNIPPDYAYCDHICDMIPPIRTWATTYYTAPFNARVGGDGFLIIASKNNQNIYRSDARTGKRLYASLNKYQTYFRYDIDQASRWESDAPFLLVQYINSTTWPGDGIDNNGIGDPAMVVVNAVEQFTPKILFQTPTILGGQTSFQNFVNIVVRKDQELTTLFDGKPLISAPGGAKLTVDNLYVVYRFTSVKPGTHSIVGDSGVGCYIYGYGSYDSYAWVGAYGTGTFNSPDTIAPAVVTNGQCFDATVKTTDIHIDASKLSSVNLDTAYNMDVLIDPNFIPGAGFDSTFYTMNVVDNTLEAYLQVTIFDRAGNSTVVKSVYKPQIASIAPPIKSFGTVTGGTAVYDYITITNEGQVKFDLEILKLLKGNRGFTIDSVDLSPLAVGETRRIKIKFQPVSSASASDTLVFGDACILKKSVLIGSGGQPDFAVTDDDFGVIPVGTNKTNQQVVLTNLSDKIAITIDKITTDQANFEFLDGATLPIILPPNGKVPLNFRFTATKAGSDFAHGTFNSVEVGPKTDSLYGVGIEPNTTIREDTTLTVSCPAPNQVMELEFTLHNSGSIQTFEQVESVKLNGSPSYKNLRYYNGNLNPVSLPYSLKGNEDLIIRVDFDVTGLASGTYKADIFALNARQETIDKVVHATGNVEIRSIALDQTNANLGAFLLGDAKQKFTFRVSNNGDRDVLFDQVVTVPPAIGYAVEGYRNMAGNAVTVPQTLAPGQYITVEYSFDPSTLTKTGPYPGKFFTNSNACLQYEFDAAAVAGTGSGKALGFALPNPIFSCNGAIDSLHVTSVNSPMLTDRVTNVNIVGANPANFTILNPPPYTVQGGSTVGIPVLFTPTAGSALTSYSAVAQITFVNSAGEITILDAPVSASSVGIATSFSSIFGNNSAEAGKSISLPIDFTVNKNGLTMPFSQVGIRKVVLTYTFDQDLLSINPATDVSGLPANWSVDPSSSITGNTLRLVLVGTTELIDGVNSLGNLNFTTNLTKANTSTDVKLANVELYQANDLALANCVTTSYVSGDFSLILRCGDKTIQGFMKGNRSFARILPATPNPATSANNVVTFQYALRVLAPVSLTVYDMVGNVAATVVNNVEHEPGVYQVTLDTKSLPSGNYIYRFETNGLVSSEKLVVNH